MHEFEKDWSWEELIFNAWERETKAEDEGLVLGSPEAEAFEREFWAEISEG